jgi:hypothetical protein
MRSSARPEKNESYCSGNDRCTRALDLDRPGKATSILSKKTAIIAAPSNVHSSCTRIGAAAMWESVLHLQRQRIAEYAIISIKKFLTNLPRWRIRRTAPSNTSAATRKMVRPSPI